MRITNYNELFKLFDQILSLSADDFQFLCVNHSKAFNLVIDSYYRSTSVYSDERDIRISRLSHAGMLSALSIGVSSLISCPDKKKAHRYQLSFESSFNFFVNYLRKPYNYFVYNIYPNDVDVNISRNLFVNSVNLVISYNNRIFVVHLYNEYSDSAPFITLLSPSIMFNGDISSFDYIQCFQENYLMFFRV